MVVGRQARSSPAHPMTYGSICSGIEAVSVAGSRLDFALAWFAEIDPFCSALLASPLSPALRTLATSPASKPVQLTCWPEGLPASPSPSPAGEVAWRTRVATWPSSFAALLADCGLGGLSGKTSPVFCRRMAGGTLVPSSGRWRNSVWLRLASAGRSVPRSAPATPSRLRCRTSWRLAACRGGTT